MAGAARVNVAISMEDIKFKKIWSIPSYELIIRYKSAMMTLKFIVCNVVHKIFQL